MDKPEDVKRIAVYISEAKHRQLTAKLALKGLKVADWIRNKVDEELENDDE